MKIQQESLNTESPLMLRACNRFEWEKKTLKKELWQGLLIVFENLTSLCLKLEITLFEGPGVSKLFATVFRISDLGT